MVHGGTRTGTTYTGTPDGRESWAQYFARRGYGVYVVDQPGRGRSGYVTEAYGPQTLADGESGERSAVPVTGGKPKHSSRFGGIQTARHLCQWFWRQEGANHRRANSWLQLPTRPHLLSRANLGPS
jgi:pimeloyl-ACP methyl ester carboxylesterase